MEALVEKQMLKQNQKILELEQRLEESTKVPVINVDTGENELGEPFQHYSQQQEFNKSQADETTLAALTLSNERVEEAEKRLEEERLEKER